MDIKKGKNPKYRLLRDKARIRAGHYHAENISVRFHFNAPIIALNIRESRPFGSEKSTLSEKKVMDEIFDFIDRIRA